MAICPEGALSVGRRELGDVLWGRAANADFLMGRLRVGEAMSPPLMRSVKQRLAEMNQGSAKDVIVDAPPGVSCPAVNAVMDSDAIILVTEPTPFGLYDLQLAFEAFTPLGKPMAVVINRHGIGHQKVEDFCRSQNLPILAKIPYSREVAEAYAQGKVIAAALPQLHQQFSDMAVQAEKLVTGHREALHA
jgi:MinD superfamily P-loop ATPase